MASDYKREAFIEFITEMYCVGERKYTGKNRDLIERALFGNAEWLRLKEMLKEKMNQNMAKLEGEKLPPHIMLTIQRLYEHFQKFMEIQDIDKNTAETMLMIFKSNTDDGDQFDFESSEEEVEVSPGKQLAAAQKQDNNYNEAGKFLYKATLKKMDTFASPGLRGIKSVNLADRLNNKSPIGG